jgi:hypothetical protein
VLQTVRAGRQRRSAERLVAATGWLSNSSGQKLCAG